jgi:hypothetical protein
MTPNEVAKMRLDIANADALYLDRQVLAPQEVAQRFEGDCYSTELRVDLEARAELMQQQAELEALANKAGREADPEGPEALGAAGAKKALEEPAPAPSKDKP